MFFSVTSIDMREQEVCKSKEKHQKQEEEEKDHHKKVTQDFPSFLRETPRLYT